MMGKFIDKIKNVLKYYPEEDELPIDWCPICEEKMPDFKRKTRQQHNKLKHPPDPKVRLIHIRNNLISLTVIVLMISVLVYYVLLIDDARTLNEYCVSQKNVLNDLIREHGVYPFEQQPKIDSLIENCDLIFGLGGLSGYSPPESP